MGGTCVLAKAEAAVKPAQARTRTFSADMRHGRGTRISYLCSRVIWRISVRSASRPFRVAPDMAMGGAPISRAAMTSAPDDMSIGTDFGTTNTVIALAGPAGAAEALRFTQNGIVHRTY